MIEINKKKYKLCFIDTCIIREFFKNKTTIGKRIISKFLLENYIFCYNNQNFSELMKVPDVLKQLFKHMCIMPTNILKSHNQIFEDELKEYPNSNIISPVFFSIPMLKKDDDYRKLNDAFYTKENIELLKDEVKELPFILAYLTSLVGKYFQNFGSNSKKNIELGVESEALLRIKERNESILKDILESNKDFLKLDIFLSLKMILYITFYKFYYKYRKPRLSDVNDILMSSCYPYIDAVITEKDMAETLRQIQKKHNFITRLEIMNINNFRT